MSEALQTVKTRLIWSADVSLDDLILVLGSNLIPKGGMIVKLDRYFLEKYGRESIKIVQDLGYPVFVDAKIIEVPKKVLQITDLYLEYQPYMLNVMAGACSTGDFANDNPNKVELLKRFADKCKSVGTRPCVVTVLTSKNAAFVEREYCTRSALLQVLWYVDLAYESGITDIVCSPLEAEEIRAIPKYKELTLNTPGVRMVGTDVRDQARVTTPAQAILNGADKIVVGSNLTDGDDYIPVRVSKNFEKLRMHVIDEASIDIVDGIECT